jgi:hypothetical protein
MVEPWRLGTGRPTLATRQELFDFVVEELAQRELEDVRRIRPLRVALQNQRDDLLAFAGVPDKRLAHIARTYEVGEDQSWTQLRTKMGDRAREGGGKFHTLFDAVSRARLAKVPAAKPLE